MEIRFCTHSDIERVMSFLGEQWSVNHVLSKSRELMNWQHSGTQGGDYDFVAAFDGDDVLGCLGFILISRFDAALVERDTIWLTTWKVVEDGPRGLGLQLHAFVRKSVPHRSIGTVGNNSKVEMIYRALGYETGAMSQHYVLHPKLADFKLARVPNGSPRIGKEIDASATPTLYKLDAEGIRAHTGGLAGAWPENAVPYKSLGYYINRFIERPPFYTYDVYAIERDGAVRGLIVARLSDSDGARALRLVDAYASADALRGIARPLQDLLEAEDAEYADLYQTGFDDDAIKSAGLITLEDLEGDVIIPNYFEPFLRKNVVLNWSYKLEDDQRVIAFKADCDQDRPNLLP